MQLTEVKETVLKNWRKIYGSDGFNKFRNIATSKWGSQQLTFFGFCFVLGFCGFFPHSGTEEI